MNTLEHIAISASAGSGKTYTLTNRFIQLLHLAEQPERIIALTFTRTAAGEFFHKIIEKLCDAASDSDKADQLSKELAIQADCARYHTLLDCLIRQMHQLNLQTLDSFFFRVVSAFALELGLSGSLNLMDESMEPRLRNQVRDHMVHRPGELSSELQEFWHAFKQATYGQEARSIEDKVSDQIETLYSLFLDTPDAARWGQASAIWAQNCPWQTTGAIDWDQLADQLLTALPDEISASQRKDFESASSKLRTYSKDNKLNKLLERALAQADEILAGQTVLQCGRGKNNQLHLSGRACTTLADVIRAIMWSHLERALQTTQGVYRILQAYHKHYDRLVRRPGRLAFADLIHLLSPDTAGSPMGKVDEATRQLMDFRLDGHYDHWLFDEFQDTSRPQWQVVANLIDEIVQDGSGERSFFYVGDTKQCLYLWRNSDDRLFHEILGHYNGIIKTDTLATSWRSAPAILDAVNTVFADKAWIAECFSSDTAARWERAWQKHAASPATEHLSGYACWLETQKDVGPSRNERILQLLQDLNPIERGMSVGVLVRKNKDANEIADFLREHSQSPIHTGSAVKPACDNAAGAALLAMLRLAAHPGDQHAAGYLQLIDHSCADGQLLAATSELRSSLSTSSYESLVRQAAQTIEAVLPNNDQRHRQRLDQLIQIARRFDCDEQRNIDALIDTLETSSSGECPNTEAVIIETIHKSKGLEYDVVILVNEDKTNRSDSRIHALMNSQGEAEWVLKPAPKDIMQADPALSQLQEQDDSQAGFGRLCTLYVGMTRAKRALYMISELKGAHKSTTVDFMREMLGSESDENGVLWQTGAPDWDQHWSAPKPESEEAVRPMRSHFRPAHPRLQLARPSEAKSTQLNGGSLFDLSEQAGRFGTVVHAAFEQLAWLADAANLKHPTLQNCFENPGIRDCFTQPSVDCELWREKAFSYVEGDQFYSGVFDRVHLYRDASGSLVRAEIIDFKTDRIHQSNTVKAATEQHRPQMESYRKAIATITGLPEDAISAKLLFTDNASLICL